MRALLVLALIIPLPALAQTDRPGLRVWGDARMGVVWADRPAPLGPPEKGLRLSSRARLHFQFIGETDGGTQFGFNFGVNRGVNRPARTSGFVGR